MGWLVATLAIGALAAGGFFIYRHLQTPRMPTAVQTLNEAAARSITPKMLPDMVLTGLDGKPYHTTAWRGKVMVLNFWATWCPPCRHEIPEFITLQRRYGPKGVQFVGVAIDRTARVRMFVRAKGLNYPQLLGQEKGVELAEQLGNRVGALPFTVVVDRSGRIVAKVFGEWGVQGVERTLQPLL